MRFKTVISLEYHDFDKCLIALNTLTKENLKKDAKMSISSVDVQIFNYKDEVNDFRHEILNDKLCAVFQSKMNK